MLVYYKPCLVKLEDVVKDITDDIERQKSLLLYFRLNVCPKGEVTWLRIPKTREELDSCEYEMAMLFLSVLSWTDLRYGNAFLLEG